MRALSHCKILWENNEAEYANFYDLETAEKRFASKIESTGDTDNVLFVSNNNELVLADKNKALGHRALQVYYKQRPHNSQQQLITSLMQEHNRLAAIERQQETNMDQSALNTKFDWSLKLGMKNNNYKHRRRLKC